jgi:hypothetical protein
LYDADETISRIDVPIPTVSPRQSLLTDSAP